MQHSGGLLLQGFECHLWLAGTNTPSAADSSPVPQHGLQPSASTSSSADQHSTCFACRSQSNERRGQPPLDPLLEHAGARQYIRCKLQLVDGLPSTEAQYLPGRSLLTVERLAPASVQWMACRLPELQQHTSYTDAHPPAVSHLSPSAAVGIKKNP